jgi:amidohydrolase
MKDHVEGMGEGAPSGSLAEAYSAARGMSPRMREIAEDVRTHPELGLEERHACAVLSDELEREGFAVERGLGSLPTAFRARKAFGAVGPTVAFLAEYDALPGIGHGCAHSLVGTSAVFAAISLARSLEARPGVRGTVQVIGTPAEETKGGKIILLREGFFDGVDFALMSHPATVNEVCRGGRAITSVTVRFTGKAAHSSDPSKGVNALQAAMLFNHAIDAIFQSFPDGVSVNAILPSGGDADNAVPGYAELKYSIRGKAVGDVESTLWRFGKVAEGISMAVGAAVELIEEVVYAERRSNATLELAFKSHLEALGEEVEVADPNGRYGSSDIGNVSLKMPAMHPYWRFWKGSDRPNAHTVEFARAAGEDEAYAGLERAVAAMAAVGADLLLDRAFASRVWDEFRESVGGPVRDGA